MIAKLVFLSEFIRASQHEESATRRSAIAASPLLSQYLTGTTVPKVLKNAEQVTELSSAQLAKNLEAMERRVTSRRSNWKPTTLVAYDILALPGESFPHLDKNRLPRDLRLDKGGCSRDLTLLLITGGSVAAGIWGTVQYFRWKDQNQANQNPNVPAANPPPPPKGPRPP